MALYTSGYATPGMANPSGRIVSGYGQPASSFMPAALNPTDEFLKTIGAAKLDANGRPIGSTGGAIGLSPEQESQLASLNPKPPATAGSAPAAAPGGTNPLASLNSKLGLNLGAPFEGSVLKQATQGLPSGAQIGGAIADTQDSQKAATFDRLMRERGGYPIPGDINYNEQMATQQATFNSVYGDQQGNAFLAPARAGNANMGGGPAPTGQQVLAAGGKPVTGYGGTQISGETVQGGYQTTTGNRTPGTHNRFTLTQAPNSMMPQPIAPVANAVPAGPVATPMAGGGVDLTAGLEAMRKGATVQDLRNSGFNNPARTVPVDNQVASSGVELAAAAPAGQSVSPLDQAQAQYKAAVSDATNLRNRGVLEPGYQWDPANPTVARPIPGSEAEKKVQEEAAAKGEKSTQAWDQSRLVVNTVNKMLPNLNTMTTGPVAALTGAIPGTPAYDMNAMRDTVVSNIGSSQLAAMRSASKNGASGLGALSERELDMLQSSLGNVKLAQNTRQLSSALKDVRNHFIRWQATHAAGSGGSPKDATAVKWALANPNNPNSEKILSTFQN